MIRFTVRLAALGLILYLLGLAAFAVLLPRPAGAERTDAIVVLTGRGARLERGFALLREGRAPRLFISGVARTVRPAELGALYEVDPALIDCCVILGRESFDTRSNADEVSRWVERRRIRSIRLVTDDTHMPRARYELEKRAQPELAIVADALPTDPDLGDLFLEYNKYLLGRAADLIGL